MRENLLRSESTEIRFKALEARISELEAEMLVRRVERDFLVDLLRVIGPKLGVGVVSGCASRALMSAAARGLPEFRLRELQSSLHAFVAKSSDGSPTM